MALSDIAVNWASVFANGTLTAASVGTTWNNKDRIADFFTKEVAQTAGTPSGLTEIKIDQGATPASYLSANRIIIPALHNIGVALTLEYNSTDSWAGSQTAVTLSPSATPVAGTLFSASFAKVTAGAGNRWWRLSFTKTDAAIQIPEVWLTEKIVLGQSEATPGISGQPDSPTPFNVRQNVIVLSSLEGIRSVVEQGPALREIELSGTGLSASAFADWEGLFNGTIGGVRKFYLDDPRGGVWLASLTSDFDRRLESGELWTARLRMVETF